MRYGNGAPLADPCIGPAEFVQRGPMSKQQQRQAPDIAPIVSPDRGSVADGPDNSVVQSQMGTARGEAETPLLAAAEAQAPTVVSPAQGAIPMAGGPTITIQNEFPDVGGDKARTKVGVKEKVWLQASTDGGTWSASGGTGSVLKDETYEWRAPITAGPVTITYTPTGGGTPVVTTINVVVPDALTATSSSARSYTGQGAGMDLQLQVGPTDVSFTNIGWLEDPGPATDVTGYFVGKPADKLAHKPNARWSPIGGANALGDVAEFNGWPGPYKEGGSYTWSIPNRWRADNGTGTVFHTSTQVMTIAADGTSSVTKLGKP